MDIRFYKLHVCGSDWLLTDRMGEDSAPAPDFEALSSALCRRRRGVGGNGLIALSKPEEDVWAECYGPDGTPRPLSPDAALCAARYLFDSGRAGKNDVELRTREGTMKVDIIDSTRFALSLGQARSLSGSALREGDADHSAAAVELAGRAYSILPVRVAEESFAVVITEGGFKDALSPFDSPSPADSERQRITPLAVRVISRTKLAAGGSFSDACSAAGAALAAADAYGLADREVAVRLGGDDIYVNADTDDGIYTAARPVYVFSGEYWMDGPAEPEEEEEDGSQTS